MRLFIYEFMTGGGAMGQQESDFAGLAVEGKAMVQALASDLSHIPDMQVELMRDYRLPPLDSGVINHRIESGQDEAVLFSNLAHDCDATLLIAPELDGILADRAALAERVGGRLISPSYEAIKIASDKLLTKERFIAAGTPAPPAFAVHDSGRIPELQTRLGCTAVLKRNDGAGSTGTRLLSNALVELGREFDICQERPWMLEEYVPGDSVSVSFLCGAQQTIPLPPFRQLLGSQFAYEGGQRLLDTELVDRAQRLALRALDALPQLIGYVGVDLILGRANDGSDDTVLEINPRLTTSYLGIRETTEANVARAMLDVAHSKPVSLDYSKKPVSFHVPCGENFEVAR